MKEIVSFIKWQWNKLETWQKIFMFSMFLMGFTAFRTDEVSRVIFYATSAVPFIFMAKWFMLDPLLDSWKSYKKEKAELFDVIKGDK